MQIDRFIFLISQAILWYSYNLFTYLSHVDFVGALRNPFCYHSFPVGTISEKL